MKTRPSDGKRVPVSLVYRKGMKQDGQSPCLLYGYGSYGATIDPGFSSVRVSLLDRGFVYAIANIRGGGALGVGRATRTAVRDSIIAVIISNYFMTWLIQAT